MKAFAISALIVFVLDQLTKLIVLLGVFDLSMEELTSMDGNFPYPASVPVFDPFLVLTMAWNRGVNFGLFAGLDMRWVLVGVAVAISLAVTVWLWRKGATRWGYIAGGVLVGGALGNVVDRVLYGAVADFLNMSCCGIDNPFAFNIADVAIFLGAVGLALLPEGSKAKA